MKNKCSWGITLAIEYIFIFILSWLTPLYADDLIEVHLSLIQIIQRTWNDLNPRFFGQFIYRILDNIPVIIFALVNAGVFCIFTLLIFKIAVRNHPSLLKYIITLSVVLIMLPNFGQTVLWKAGTGNYLWVTTIILLYLAGNFSEELCGQKLTKHWIIYLLPLTSFIAGWGNENTSCAVLILSGLIIFYNRLVKKLPFKKWQIINTLFLLIGYIFMMLSPSSFRRSKMGITNVFTTSDNTLVSNVVTSCIDIILTLARYYFVLLILIAVFALIMHRCYFSQTKAANALFFIITGILSIMALIFAPSYTWDGGRAYFGGITFLIIALIILLPDDIRLFMSQNVMRYASTFTFLVILFGGVLVYLSCGIYDWHKSSQAINQRYEYIQKQVDSGKEQVRVTPFVYYPKMKYAVNFGLNEISNNQKYFINQGYFRYFPGLKKIIPDF